MSNFVSVAHAGGQGKTTVAQLLYLLAKRAKIDAKLVAADYVDDSGRSKLGKLFPGTVEEFGVGAALTASRTENNPNAAVRYWDKMGHIFLNDGHIIDVGANVFGPILQWSRDRQLPLLIERRNAPRVDVICVTRAEKHALDNISLLVDQVTAEGAFPVGRVFIVENEVGGAFDGMSVSDALEKRSHSKPLNFIRLPRCQSEIWPGMEQTGTSIEAALGMDEDEMVDAFGVDLWTASAGLAELRAWVSFAEQRFNEVEIFGKQRSGRVKAAPVAA